MTLLSNVTTRLVHRTQRLTAVHTPTVRWFTLAHEWDSAPFRALPPGVTLW